MHEGTLDFFLQLEDFFALILYDLMGVIQILLMALEFFFFGKQCGGLLLPLFKLLSSLAKFLLEMADNFSPRCGILQDGLLARRLN